MPSHLEQALAKIEEFEGAVPWMYLDSVGRVRVGSANLLPDADAARRLPFQIGALPATSDEIDREFTRVEASPMGRPARFYCRAGCPELELPVIAALLRTTLVGFEEELRQAIPAYDFCPGAAKIALLDMAYDLGPSTLLRRYPRLIRAVERGAWAQAAAVSFRHGPGAARNQWTRAMFMGKVVDVGPTLDGPLKKLGYGVVGAAAALWGRIRRKR